VAQNGRRGALMLSIDVRHPDVADFISIKSDRSKVTGANISVSLRDDFMEAVKKDDDYILQYPVDADVRFQSPVEKYNVLEKRGEWVGKNGEKVDIWLKKVRAKELYALIIKNAWENAEPGQIFIDRHWNYSPDGVYPQYRGITTNPCVVGDTMIKTDKGELKISEIVDRFNDGEIFKALSYNENTKAMEYKPIFNAQKTEEDATILEIETENGNKIRLTPNHKVYTEEDGWIESSKLTINHTILEIID
jgi:ribonucleoside-diphosphate reductase alpha chain